MSIDQKVRLPGQPDFNPYSSGVSALDQGEYQHKKVDLIDVDRETDTKSDFPLPEKGVKTRKASELIVDLPEDKKSDLPPSYESLFPEGSGDTKKPVEDKEFSSVKGDGDDLPPPSYDDYMKGECHRLEAENSKLKASNSELKEKLDSQESISKEREHQSSLEIKALKDKRDLLSQKLASRDEEEKIHKNELEKLTEELHKRKAELKNLERKNSRFGSKKSGLALIVAQQKQEIAMKQQQINKLHQKVKELNARRTKSVNFCHYHLGSSKTSFLGLFDFRASTPACRRKKKYPHFSGRPQRQKPRVTKSKRRMHSTFKPNTGYSKVKMSFNKQKVQEKTASYFTLAAFFAPVFTLELSVVCFGFVNWGLKTKISF